MSDPQPLQQGLWTMHAGVRRDLVFTRHLLRGVPHYAVHDPLTFENHLFDAVEYRILTRIESGRTLAEVFTGLVADGVLAAAGAADFHDFVVSLHGIGILQMPAADAVALFARRERRRRAQRSGAWKRLVYWKIPLLDPERFLDRTAGLFGLAFSRVGVLVWCAILGLAVWKCWGRLGEMFAASASLLALANIPVLFLALVVLKIIHEFGHAFACKRYGCEVPEMGAVLIFMTPCAYVDASASWKLASRWQRIVIGLGGMYVEIVVAAVCALVWAGTEPGLLHDIAVNVIVLASLVTVLFNLNPLMRFDGYYVFSDLLGVHNLAERSRSFLAALGKRVCLGLDVAAEHAPRGEALLLGAYGVGAAVYKVFLGAAIVAMVLTSWPFAGTLIGLAFAHLFLVRPLLRLGRYLTTHPETAPVRGRATVLAYGGLIAAPAALACVPLSRHVVVPGVLEPAHRLVLRAPSDGVVQGFGAAIGTRVGTAGSPVVRLHNETLALELVQARADVAVARTRFAAAEVTDPGAAGGFRARAAVLAERCARLRARVDGLAVQAPRAGILAVHHGIPGRFARAGDALVEVHSGGPRVRIVLAAAEVARMRLEAGAILELRWRVQPGRVVSARVRGVLPAASRDAVPPALTVLGGGEIYGERRPDAGLRAEQAYLQVVLEPDWVPPGRTAGLTARVRIPAAVETVGAWVYQRLSGFYNSWRMS